VAAAIELRNLRKTYPGKVVGLDAIDLTVESSERLVILGPSGAGKSTLLRLIAGLETPESGEIWLDGKLANKIPPHLRDIGWLPQRAALYPQLTVREQLNTISQSTSQTVHFDEVVSLLTLESYLARYPHQLSGGEKQRVALARLLLRGASVWLLDEPFASLDPQFRDEFRHDLHLLLDRTLATMITVSHDAIDATALGRRIGVLGHGRFQQIGTPDQLMTSPSNRFVAFCLGRYCFLDGTVTDQHEPNFVSDCGSLRLPLPSQRPGRRLSLGLRAEDVGLRIAENATEGWKILAADPQGSGWRLTIAKGRSRIWAEWRTGSPPPTGTAVDWWIANEGLWFDADSGERLP